MSYLLLPFYRWMANHPYQFCLYWFLAVAPFVFIFGGP